nr:MAG TPA: hypothetical protein [Caudoviricetes sp.]
MRKRHENLKITIFRGHNHTYNMSRTANGPL